MEKQNLKKLYSSLVRPSIVKAVVTTETPLRKSNSLDSHSIEKVYPGEIVTIIQDREYKWYQVQKGNGRRGWIPNDVLIIPPEEPTNTDMLTREQIEGYVNWKGFESSTDYFVWVDIDRQMIYILKKDGMGKWSLIRKMLCCTGKNKSPTKRGVYKIKDRGEWFYSKTFDSGAMYWVRYCGSYLFHSIAMNTDKKVIDESLGKKASAGCIRMTLEDSRWFYNNIPKRTSVYIN